MLTADTITDHDIRKLRGESPGLELSRICAEALAPVKPGCTRRHHARVRCVQLINAINSAPAITTLVAALEVLPLIADNEGDYAELVDEANEQGPVRICSRDGQVRILMSREDYDALVVPPVTKKNEVPMCPRSTIGGHACEHYRPENRCEDCPLRVHGG